jgi:hypothetical protein
LLHLRYAFDTPEIFLPEDSCPFLFTVVTALPWEIINYMESSDQYNFRLSKYHKLNLIVIVIILAILLAVFFWYERSLDKLDEEMTKEMITQKSV